MTELLPRLFAGDFDCSAPYSEQNYPPFQEQIHFFDYALQEAALLEYSQRTVRGPHHKAFNAILGDIQQQLGDIDPHLGPECVMPTAYRPPEAFLAVASLQGRKVA